MTVHHQAIWLLRLVLKNPEGPLKVIVEIDDFDMINNLFREDEAEHQENWENGACTRNTHAENEELEEE